MKKLIAGIVLPVMLAGCWGAPPNEKLLDQACTDLFLGDPEMTRNLLSESAVITVDGFCDCFAAQSIAAPTTIDLHKDVLNAINTTRAETGLGVEDAVKHIEDAKDDPAVFDTFTNQQLDDVGDFFQDVAESMGETGTCPAG